MPEYKRPKSPTEYAENFAPIHPLMNDTQAHYESSRCLFCYDAPCINACPTGIDIPLFIRQINSGNVTGAARTIYEANYFGHACGNVCPTEVLCEGACVYNHQDVKPIEIGRLQSYATDQVIRTDKQLFQPARPNGYKVAVIGAGPAGISCACELRMYGYEVDILEAKELPSGLTVYGVAPYKITNEEALEEMAWLEKQFGFCVYYKRPIKSRADLDQLEEQYDAIFLGIGLGNTRPMGLPGEELEGVWGATEFIEQLRLEQENAMAGQRVVVVGGGNTAMDAASESARMGAEVVGIAYRRSQAEMGAYPFEYELAKGAGVSAWFNAQPVAIHGESQVIGIRLVQTETVDGKVQQLPDSEFDLPCDMVILATGQEKQTSFLSQIHDLSLDKKGRIQVKADHQTDNPMYFAAGDAVNGGAEVVNAVAEGKKAARGIHDYLFLTKNN